MAALNAPAPGSHQRADDGSSTATATVAGPMSSATVPVTADTPRGSDAVATAETLRRLGAFLGH